MFQLYQARLIKTNKQKSTESKKNDLELKMGIHYAVASITVLLLKGMNKMVVNENPLGTNL